MLVVKTTSPVTSPEPAKLQPSKAAPSSRTNVAWLRPTLCTYSKPRSSPVVYQTSANYSTHDPARQGPPEKWRVGRVADQGAAIHHPVLREIHERQVRHRADREAPPLPDPPPGRRAHRPYESVEREPAVEDELRVERGERGLMAEESRGGLLQRELLLL